MRVGQDELAWWLEYYPNLKWTFASTYAETAPHHYVVRGKTIRMYEGDVLLHLIRTFGDPQKYWHTTGLYLVRDGFKWWFDWRWVPMSECMVINMAPADQFFGDQDAPQTRSRYWGVYDSLCVDYDRIVPGIHDDYVASVIKEHVPGMNPKILDVGAGTGRLLDMKITRPERVVAVDPSQGMLNTLLMKHHVPPRGPRVGDVRPAKIEDVVDMFIPEEFDAVVALYGSASYVKPEVVRELPNLAKTATILMTYKGGFVPSYHQGWEQPQHIDEVARVVKEMGGERHDLGVYDLTVIKNSLTLF